MEKFKDVTIMHETYRIGLMDALTGSMVLALIAPKLIEVMTDTTQLNMLIIMKLIPMLGDDLKKIQVACLKVCCSYTAGQPVPIMMNDGRWGNKELETDTMVVLTLTAHTIVYNLSPFFSDKGLPMMMESLQGAMQPALTT